MTVYFFIYIPYWSHLNLFHDSESGSCRIFITFFSKINKIIYPCQPILKQNFLWVRISAFEHHRATWWLLKPLKYVHDFWIMFVSNMCMISGSCLHHFAYIQYIECIVCNPPCRFPWSNPGHSALKLSSCWWSDLSTANNSNQMFQI